MTSQEQNKALARRIIESYNGPTEQMQHIRDEAMSPDIVVHIPSVGTFHGRDAFTDYVASRGGPGAPFSDDHMEPLEQVAEGDLVTTRWTWSFTHSGVYRDMPPTGRRITITGITMERFRGDQVVERWAHLDEAGIWVQITGNG
jgi:predicted ester cyclase